MKSFGSRRKARVIRVDDPEEPENAPEAPAKVAEANPPPVPLFANVTRKPFKQSGLRKSINVEEASVDDDEPARIPAAKASAAAGDEDDEGGNVVVRPALSRAVSTKQKKRKSTSRLSFGIRAEEDDDDDDNDATTGAPSSGLQYEATTPKKKGEGGGLKKAVALKDLAMRSRAENDDRPRYSREYLEELQSSTPNTPAPASRGDGVPVEAEDSEMDLDASELEGAMIVDSPSLSTQPATATAATTRILTAAEIREKKERRARLAHESDFISLNDEDDDDDDVPARKKKDDTRLVREDENILEGFDDFVEDEDVALGRRAEREARRRRREEMASLIRDAEGNSGEESDESDAERRAAFEAAQSRAGMDGLRLPAQRKNPADPAAAARPRVTPLRSMAECLQGLQGSLDAMRVELEGRSKKVAELRREREEIRSREKEVQRLVDEAGEKYRAAAAGAGASAGALEAGGDSPAAVHMLSKESVGFAAERGLESFGTPTSKGHDGDVAV